LRPDVWNAGTYERREGSPNKEGGFFEKVEVLTVDLAFVWNGALSLFVGLFAYIAHEKFSELARITILLNKTREEIARDNVTKAEVDRITDHIDQRFNRLETKIDQLIESQRRVL
jgi:hypothetical protein